MAESRPDQISSDGNCTPRPGCGPSGPRWGYLDVRAAVNSTTADSAHTGIPVSQLISRGESLSIGAVLDGILLVGIALAGMPALGMT